MSQREVLDRIVRVGYDSKEGLVASFREETGTGSDEWQGLSDDERDALLAETSDWGFETSEEEIDEILYGR